MVKTLTIIQPDDWHVHLRDNLVLQDSVPASAKHFARALVMPNLKPALTTVTALQAYRERILASLKAPSSFIPFMTLYLNEQLPAQELDAAIKDPFILGAKLYPAGATTNSEEGVQSLRALYPVLSLMEQKNLVLQVHGEMTEGDIFQREALFIKNCLAPLIKNFPKLRIVLEHISTAAAVEFVSQAPATVAATITAHHLLLNRNHLLAGGIRPHYYCLPILKTEKDQHSLQQAATSGNPKFFAGTDSAPHAQNQKESSCGCAGIYSAPYAVEFYTQLFDSLDKIPQLEAFLSRFGAEFYQLPSNTTTITLAKKPQLIPSRLPLGNEQIIPFGAETYVQWTVL